jgi:hypothetical protein
LALIRSGSGTVELMVTSFHKRSRAAVRSIAIFSAALMLVSQFIGVAHFHEGSVSRDGIAAAQISADPGLCPVCQLALHSPGSVAAATTVACGPAVAEAVFPAAPARFESPVFASARVRAPPVAL